MAGEINEREIARSVSKRISDLSIFDGSMIHYAQFINSVESIFLEIPEESTISRANLIGRIMNLKLTPEIYHTINSNNLRNFDDLKRSLNNVIYRTKGLIATLKNISKEKRKQNEDIHIFAIRIKLWKNYLISEYVNDGNTQEYAETHSETELKKAFILGLNGIQQALCAGNFDLTTVDDCVEYLKGTEYLFTEDEENFDDNPASFDEIASQFDNMHFNAEENEEDYYHGQEEEYDNFHEDNFQLQEDQDCQNNCQNKIQVRDNEYSESPCNNKGWSMMAGTSRKN